MQGVGRVHDPRGELVLPARPAYSRARAADPDKEGRGEGAPERAARGTAQDSGEEGGGKNNTKAKFTQ